MVKLQRIGNRDYFCESHMATIRYCEMMRFYAIYMRCDGIPAIAFNTLRECRVYLSNLISEQLECI